MTEKVKKISCRKFRSLGKKGVGISEALNVGIFGDCVGKIAAPHSTCTNSTSTTHFKRVLRIFLNVVVIRMSTHVHAHGFNIAGLIGNWHAMSYVFALFCMRLIP